MTMLLVIKPLTLVVCAVGVGVRAHSLSLIVDPLALVDVAICVHKLALAICFIISPLTLIATTIWPKLSANTVTHAVEPLTSVCGSITKSKWTFVNSTVLICFLVRHDIGLAFAECATAFSIIYINSNKCEHILGTKYI